MPYSGPDLSTTVAGFAGEYAITHLVLGPSQRPWYQRWFGQSVLERLLRAVPGVDVLIVDTSK
jgi:two-component system sensor histidine kinase KdpD